MHLSSICTNTGPVEAQSYQHFLRAGFIKSTLSPSSFGVKKGRKPLKRKASPRCSSMISTILPFSKRLPVNMTVCGGLLTLHFRADHVAVVIHTADGFHTASAKALILGLGDRKKLTGNTVHYIHVSVPSLHCITVCSHLPRRPEPPMWEISPSLGSTTKPMTSQTSQIYTPTRSTESLSRPTPNELLTSSRWKLVSKSAFQPQSSCLPQSTDLEVEHSTKFPFKSRL